MPVNPLEVKGKIYDINGIVVDSATVSLVHLSGTLSKTSNSSGEYIFNLGDLSSYSVGDSITVSANKATKGTKSETVTIEEGGNTVNITLEETSDLTYTETEQNVHNLVFVVPTSFDGEKITHLNPLPVTNPDILLNEPSLANTYDSNKRLSTQTITVNGIQYRRTFTYTGTNFQFSLRTRWEKV